MKFHDYWLDRRKYSEIIRLAVPLILSHAGFVLMGFTDGMFLAKYSPEAIAASGMSGMVNWLAASLFIGVVGYAGTITANNIGAKRESMIGTVIWQSVHLAIAFGALSFLLGFLAEPLFRIVGHDDIVRQYETEYLRIALFGNVTFFLSAALGGFMSGRGDNIRLMLAQLSGQLLNILLDYLMIFGHWGLPEMGVSGAALATVLSALLPSAILFFYFLRRGSRDRYHSGNWRINFSIMGRLWRFGIANGIQMCIDAALWSVFLLLVGRIGAVELSATAIAFRLNNLTIMPVIGLSRGMSTLVGQRHGSRDHDSAVMYICHGLALSELWMYIVGIAYVLFTEEFFDMFASSEHRGKVDFAEVRRIGCTLLMFVAGYSLFDAFNITLCSGLHAVGDTKWTSIVVCSITLAVTGTLFLVVRLGGGIYAIWTTATLFIVLLPIVWILRLRSDHWRHIRVATD